MINMNVANQSQTDNPNIPTYSDTPNINSDYVDPFSDELPPPFYLPLLERHNAVVCNPTTNPTNENQEV